MMVNGRDDGDKLNGVDMSNPPDQKDQNTVTRTKHATQSETGSTTNEGDPQILMGTQKTIQNTKKPNPIPAVQLIKATSGSSWEQVQHTKNPSSNKIPTKSYPTLLVIQPIVPFTNWSF